MLEYRYLIIGGGMTADTAVRGIRQVDREGSIGLISAENHPPYNRPPLSKGLWKGRPLKNIWRVDAAREVTLHLGRWVRSLDAKDKSVIDDQGTTYRYEKLLLATGGTPRQLLGVPGSPLMLYYRTLDDYQALRSVAEQHERFAVIGGGFIGSEIAAALAMIGKKVVMMFPESGIGGRMFPPELSQFLNDYYRQHGVDVRPGEQVLNVQAGKDRCTVYSRSERDQRESETVVDAVVAGLGIQPNTELAQQAGLEVGNGIRVDATLRTSDPNIFAAGDVAEFFNPALNKYLRVEHEDNANTMGEMAGRSMAGDSVRYDHLPLFYSDLFDVGFEAVGEINSRLETVADWKDPFREGVIYYMRQGRVRGVLLWNVWQRIDAARQLIAEAGPFRREDLLVRLLEREKVS